MSFKKNKKYRITHTNLPCCQAAACLNTVVSKLDLNCCPTPQSCKLEQFLQFQRSEKFLRKDPEERRERKKKRERENDPRYFTSLTWQARTESKENKASKNLKGWVPIYIHFLRIDLCCPSGYNGTLSGPHS